MKDTFVISEETISKILQKYKLGQLFTFDEIKTGLINPVFIVNKQYILRVNTKQTKENKQKFKKEALLYSLLSESHIPTPKCIAHDFSGEIIKEDYLLISYIEGETLTEAFKKGSKEVQYKLAFQLGEIAKKIHSTDISKISLRSELFGNMEDWNKTIKSEFAEYLDLVKKKRLLSEKIVYGIEVVLKEYASLGNLSKKVALIHGDFSCNNFQVRNGEIVGVFDFEMSTLGDPYYDFQKFPINFQLGDEFDQDAFLAGYGQEVMSADEKTRLQRYALSQGLWELWATETQEFPFDEKEIEEGMELITKALEM
ncbi:MAG: aminoglycoside phosphotransferase family protein [Patescibacteria group bacterium]